MHVFQSFSESGNIIVKSLWCAFELAKTDVELTSRWLTGMHSNKNLNLPFFNLAWMESLFKLQAACVDL